MLRGELLGQEGTGRQRQLEAKAGVWLERVSPALGPGSACGEPGAHALSLPIWLCCAREERKSQVTGAIGLKKRKLSGLQRTQVRYVSWNPVSLMSFLKYACAEASFLS